MINSLYKTFNITSPVAGIIISVALMLITGFAMTRITKRLRLPNVTAYILSGVLLGPYVLNLVPQDIVEGMDFLNDIALAFIAFSTGEFGYAAALSFIVAVTLMILAFLQFRAMKRQND